MSLIKELIQKKRKGKEDPIKQETLTADEREGISESPPSFKLESGSEKNNVSSKNDVGPYQMKEGENPEVQNTEGTPYQMKLKPSSHGPGCGCDGCTAQMKVAQTKSKKEKENQSLASENDGITTKMPENIQGKMEQSLGADFSQVSIHKDSGKAEQMGALAYTQGDDVHFAKGQYNPSTSKGQELLGHELTHVTQQKAGRVKATSQKKGVGVNEDTSLEKEADLKGRKAANSKGETTQPVQAKSPATKQNSSGKPVQGIFGKIWKGIKKGAKKVGGAIKKGAGKVWGGIKKGAGKVWGGIKKGAGKIWGGIKKGAGKIWGGIKKGATKIWGGVKKVWNGIKWVSTKLWDKMKAIFHRVKFFITSWPKRLKRLAVLLWNGVKTLKPWSIKWWKSLGKASTWRKFGFYLFEVVLQSAEVVGLTDLYETVADFVKFNTRGLTPGERAIAQPIFGSSIDYDLVRLDLWAVLGPSWTGREYVSMHTINGWGGKITNATLIHELTHVWQYEKMGAAYMSRALHAQAVQGDAAYSYGGVSGLNANASKGLSAYNPEAQGNIVQDYYKLTAGEEVEGGSITAADIPSYQPYIDELKK